MTSFSPDAGMSLTITSSGLSQSNTTSRALGCMDPVLSGGHFAFARVKGDVCLVQVSLATPMSALTTVDAKIFRHEFITIFRLSEIKTFHPADISIIELIDEYHVRYEEESETVFVARELMDRMRKMSEKLRTPRTRISRYGVVSQFAPRR